MKVKALKTFSDKHNKKLNKLGDTIEVTEERFKEINSTQHGILVEEIKEVKKDKKKK